MKNKENKICFFLFSFGILYLRKFIQRIEMLSRKVEGLDPLKP